MRKGNELPAGTHEPVSTGTAAHGMERTLTHPNPMEEQIPVTSLPDRIWDVAIIGAGPAGCTAAIQLSAAGRSVLLVDREAFPRNKICGDCLISDALLALARTGLEERVRATGFQAAGYSVYSPGRVRVDLPGDCVVLKRELLDTILATEAVNRGATFCRGKVTLLQDTGGDTVTVHFRDSTSNPVARFAVIATGADVTLLNRAGMLRRARPSGVAVRRYLESAVELDRLVLSFDRCILPGYAWIFPLGAGIYNIGCGTFHPVDGATLKRAFQTFSKEFPLAREMLGRGRFTSALQGGRLRCGLEGADPFAGRILAAGEATGATYPFTGEGIGKAMETAAMAGELIEEGLATADKSPLRTYNARLADELKPKYRGYEEAQRWISYPWLVDFVAWRTRQSATLQNAAAGMLRERVDPREVFSVRGLLRSFVD